MTTKRPEVLPSRLTPVGRPPEPPAGPRPFDVHAAVALLHSLDATGAVIRATGEVAAQAGSLRAEVEAARAAGELWGQCLRFLSEYHDWGRWSMAPGVPDSVARDAAFERAGQVADAIGQPAADVLATWLRSRWTSARPCPWCRGRSGEHEARGRRGSWEP